MIYLCLIVLSTIPGHECSCRREKRKAGHKGCHVQFIWVWRPQFVCHIFSVPRIQWKLVCISRFPFAQKKEQHIWMIVYGLICTKKSYNMYKILWKKSWFVLCKKQYIAGGKCYNGIIIRWVFGVHCENEGFGNMSCPFGASRIHSSRRECKPNQISRAIKVGG